MEAMTNSFGFIVYGFNRPTGGIRRYTFELLKAFSNSGADLTLLLAGRTQSSRGEVTLYGANRLPGLLTLGQLEIAWAARRKKLDLLHDPTGVCPLFLTGACKVVTIHDVFPYIYPKTSTTLDWLIYRYWLPLALRRVDAVITDSQNSKIDILRHLPVNNEKITVIPAAASECYLPLPENEVSPVLQRHGIQRPYILYVGSIEPRKNLMRLLQAYARLRGAGQQWRLVIVGARNVWLSNPLIEVIQKLNLESWVQFTGYVSEEDLPALYNAADLFAFPSLYEGFGLPVLEAMACGTPVVTSHRSSLPEVTGDAAVLVDPYDIDAIATAMLKILTDPILAENLHARGMQRAKEFSWERTARETLAVYQKVMGAT
jgi:glycosyltransferase involved in cell wall biosynthesis